MGGSWPMNELKGKGCANCVSQKTRLYRVTDRDGWIEKYYLCRDCKKLFLGERMLWRYVVYEPGYYYRYRESAFRNYGNLETEMATSDNITFAKFRAKAVERYFEPF